MSILKAEDVLTAPSDPNEPTVGGGRATISLKANPAMTARPDPHASKNRKKRAAVGMKANDPLTAPSENRGGRASERLKAWEQVTARPDPNEQPVQEGRADSALTARAGMTALPVTNEPAHRGGRASAGLKASAPVTARPDPETLQEIRMAYRFAKTAEQSRLRIDQGLYAFARVHLTGWDPNADAKDRKKNAGRAKSVVDALIKGKAPPEGETMLHHTMEPLVTSAIGSRRAFEALEKQHEKIAKTLARQLPAWTKLSGVRGFSEWGLAVIVGEAGDIGNYVGEVHDTGIRKLYKRLGLAPDWCYPTGEKKTGRMIPRQSRGRIMGVIAEPLLRQQWRAERGGDDGGGESQEGHESHGAVDLSAANIIPAHAIGPFGQVYADAKVRQLAAGKEKGHADKLARRAMVKALLHDVHHAWHGLQLTYIKATPDA